MQLTLDDAVRRAVDNNPDLAVVRLGVEVRPRESPRAAVHSSRCFRRRLDDRAARRRHQTLLLGDQNLNVNDLFSSTGIRQRLPWGSGTWSLSWETARTTTNNPITSFDPSLQSGFELAFSQPLFRDRTIDAARQQYIIAKRNEQSSDLRFREAVVQTVAAVKQAYWNLKASLANVTVQQRSLELAQELARENSVRVAAGQNPPLDSVQAEAEVAQRRENLIRARTVAADAEDALRRLIVDPDDTSLWHLQIEPTEEPAQVGATLDVDAAVSKALGERFDLARAGDDLANAKTNADFFRNQRLPDVRLETSYRGNGLAGTQFLHTGGFPGVLAGTRNLGFGDALRQAFSNDYPDVERRPDRQLCAWSQL